ncbi:MAG: hypothetical protein ABMB14_31070 [Myxococcota bacterium]
MSIAVVAPEQQRALVLPALRCAAAGHHVTVADAPTDALGDPLLFVVVDQGDAATALQILKDAGSKARVLIIADQVEPALVRLAITHPRVVGVATSITGAPEPWETTYVTRRVLSPAEATPTASQFMTWGVTNVAWTPKSTADLRRIVKQIEDISRNLGADRRESQVVASAAHELLMNAVYDAPVNDAGQPLFAFDRQAEVALTERQRPTFRLAVGPSYIGLDATDPFGRLPRTRFFEGVLRGVSRTDGASVDTSHGGAGLGLFTLFQNGSVLRAEVHPLRVTHVSWMVRRGLAHRGRDTDRSLYFVTPPEGT